ncbi:MAG: RagB/SusD family nutrient uptake outer membrane protein [Bacteroidales bacterium]|nr:RagB/SusD family nutrient uptake outer membrane protein [Bacteroidales bacterium]MDD2425560.1 RagB/SusD family nutrient uptake outer membrane protein [Bacteroidales bacterium]MDD3990034.1 RagB/SusD family nutrient uptake outer membrane protein [Bacteroidales bacterium]
MKNKIFLIISVIATIVGFSSCENFLDETPNKSGSAYIYHMDQLYGLTGSVNLYLGNGLSADNAINNGESAFYMSEPYLMSDAIEITPDYYSHNGVGGIDPIRNYKIYSWDNSIRDNEILDLTWRAAYERIYRFNTVLENLDRVIQTTEVIRNQVEGEARFGRAYFHFMLLTQYCQWGEETPGIGYREGTNPDEIPERETVGYTMKRIYEDLQLAEECLQKAGRTQFNFSTNTRPTLPTVQAFRARVDLYRGNYESALENANAALEAHSELVNLNADVNHMMMEIPNSLMLMDKDGNMTFKSTTMLPMLMNTPGRPFLEYKELFLPNASSTMMCGSWIPISESFSNLWDKNFDLRWQKFYNIHYYYLMMSPIMGYGMIPWSNGQYLRELDFHTFCRFYTYGAYAGQIVGMTTAEMYLIKAECMVRTGASESNVAEVLKTLRRTRFSNQAVADNIGGTVKDVLDERFREMGAFWRFFDIKRLNGAENANIEIRRKVLADPTNPNAIIDLVIPANDPRWAMPIYQTQCELMGWQQNVGWE